jgi:glycosyltransferase involved in cell wall biosynthesis
VVAHSHDNIAPSVIARGVERVAAMRGSHILALSRDAAATLNPRIARDRVHVVGNGVDLSRFDAGRIDRSRARSDILPREAPTLAVVAQITPWKGQDDAVRALARVRQTLGDAQLLLVGSRKFSSVGSSHDNEGFERRLKALIDDLDLEDSVHLMGERADVEQVLRAADVVLIPSWNEPFGRVMLEAMAVGTPVVATARGGPVDVIESGVTGMLVPPRAPAALAGAALELLMNDDRRRQVIAAALSQVERYDRAGWAASVVDVYDAVLGSTRRSTT